MHDESTDPKAPVQGQEEHDPEKCPDAQGSAPNNPDELPDGSGNDAHEKDSAHGQENTGKSFDAG